MRCPVWAPTLLVGLLCAALVVGDPNSDDIVPETIQLGTEMGENLPTYENINAGRPLDIQLVCHGDIISTDGLEVTPPSYPRDMVVVQDPTVIRIQVLSQRGKASMIYGFGPEWVLKLPRTAADAENFERELRGTALLGQKGFDVPETADCTVMDRDGRNPIKALLKQYLHGFDLSDLMLAMSTTEVADGFCVTPNCQLFDYSENKLMRLTENEYKSIKGMDGGRFASWFAQRFGRENRRTSLSREIRAALGSLYGRLAEDVKSMLADAIDPNAQLHLYVFGDLKPDNMRWAIGRNGREQLFIMDVVFDETKSSKAELEKIAWQKWAFPWEAHYQRDWGLIYQFDSEKNVMVDICALDPELRDCECPAECHGPHWDKWSPPPIDDRDGALAQAQHRTD